MAEHGGPVRADANQHHEHQEERQEHEEEQRCDDDVQRPVHHPSPPRRSRHLPDRRPAVEHPGEGGDGVAQLLRTARIFGRVVPVIDCLVTVPEQRSRRCRASERSHPPFPQAPPLPPSHLNRSPVVAVPTSKGRRSSAPVDPARLCSIGIPPGHPFGCGRYLWSFCGWCDVRAAVTCQLPPETAAGGAVGGSRWTGHVAAPDRISAGYGARYLSRPRPRMLMMGCVRPWENQANGRRLTPLPQSDETTLGCDEFTMRAGPIDRRSLP